ncbi:MAG TPA: energy transducer TonB [Acidobacteriaceae bacterium]
MRAGPLQSISALLFVSAILSTPLAAQNTTPPASSDGAAAKAPAADPASVPLRKIGGGVLPPTVLHAANPQFSEQARKEKFGGVVLVTLIVDANGQPQNVHVLRGVGMGLDEKAVEAVKQYSFRPATEGGKPVPVQLNVEVNFQVLFNPPKVLHSAPLQLSPQARQAKASGTIVLGLTVDTHGYPQNVHVLRGVGMAMDERAVEAIRQYRFQPFLDGNGQPVAKGTSIELKFDAR